MNPFRPQLAFEITMVGEAAFALSFQPRNQLRIAALIQVSFREVVVLEEHLKVDSPAY